MRTLLLVLACLAHHAHAHAVKQDIDAQHRKSKIVALLLAINPSLSQTSSRGRRALNTKRHCNQTTTHDSNRAARLVEPQRSDPEGAFSKPFYLRLRGGSSVPSDESWASLQPVRVQGGELETWSFMDTERLIVALSGDDESLTTTKDEGRDLSVAISLCEGPNKTPFQLRINSQKGVRRPFKGIIETPGRHSSLFIRNMGELEFPITAGVAAQQKEDPFGREVAPATVHDMTDPYLLQGNSVKLYPLERAVKRVKVQLTTNGRPMHAKLELLKGPNEVRYEIDVYSEHGIRWPMFTILEIPGQDHAIRVVNTAGYEFPLKVDVQPV